MVSTEFWSAFICCNSIDTIIIRRSRKNYTYYYLAVSETRRGYWPPIGVGASLFWLVRSPLSSLRRGRKGPFSTSSLHRYYEPTNRLSPARLSPWRPFSPAYELTSFQHVQHNEVLQNWYLWWFRFRHNILQLLVLSDPSVSIFLLRWSQSLYGRFLFRRQEACFLSSESVSKLSIH